MEIEMTPLKLEILLWYYCTNKKFHNPSHAYEAAISEFIRIGLCNFVSATDSEDVLCFERDALKVYIQEVLRVPLPTKVWTIVKPVV